MNLKTEIFTKIRTALVDNAVKFTDIDLEPVKSIDIDYGQYRDPERFNLYQLPAIFVKTSRNESNRKNCTASVQLVICIDMTHLSSQPQLVATEDVPIFLYKYQDLIEELIESLDLGLRIQTDEEIDIENVQFYTTQIYEMGYQKVKDENLTDHDLEAMDVKVKILSGGLVAKI
jgi:hypothetical protein